MMLNKSSATVYEFGPFRFDALRRRLFRDGKPVTVQPKALDMLAVLIERRGQELEKDLLMELLWPGAAIEESNLTVTMSVLRKALGERAQEPRYVLTLPGRGYRFVAEVREVVDEGQGDGETRRREDEEAQRLNDAVVKSHPARRRSVVISVLGLCVFLVVGAAYWWRSRQSEIRNPKSAIQSIAVLPFRSLNPTQPENYLGVGLADVMITRLSNVSSLAVRPTSSVLRFAAQDPLQAGRELQVDSVLDGSIQQSGDRVRVTVRLLRVSDGQPMWANQYDELFTDIFRLQDTISERLTAALALKLSSGERQRLTRHYTENQQAWEAYAKGRYYRNRLSFKEFEKAIRAFEEAVQADSKFALAYAALAETYHWSADNSMLSDEGKVKAKDAAQKALLLDEELAEAHVSLGVFYFYYDWQFAAAEREFKRAVALNPNLADARLWYGTWLAVMGQFDASIAELKLAAQLDPISPLTRTWAGFPYFLKGDWEQAIKWNASLLENDPNLPMVQVNLAICQAEQGSYDKAIAGFERIKRAEPGSASDMDLLLAYTYVKAGQRAAAEQSLQRALTAGENLFSYDAALAYAALGDKDRAFQWLERGLKQRLSLMTWLKVDPRLNPLRDDPRFADLLRRIGLA